MINLEIDQIIMIEETEIGIGIITKTGEGIQEVEVDHMIEKEEIVEIMIGKMIEIEEDEHYKQISKSKRQFVWNEINVFEL